jgi:NADH:ubiquinone oxidoreductase subunit K
LAIVVAIVLIGYRHFDNMHTGIAAATLYLLLPYTAEYTPRIDHAVPAALLVWAVQCYRRPVLSGILIGLLAGLICYPLFLLPLWCSFYWRRGLIRFIIGLSSMLALVALSLVFTANNFHTFLADLFHTFGPDIAPAGSEVGFWGFGRLSAYRLTVFAAFAALCCSLVIWPAQKNLGSLLACTTAIMLATQLWKPYEGGTYVGWYLPLLILTIFRPNLEDRVALSAISEGWARARSK